MSAGIVEASTRGGAMGGPGLFMEWAVGKDGEIFPEGAGKIMLPDSRIRWEVHMHAMGKRVEDSYVELGVWFYPEGEEPGTARGSCSTTPPVRPASTSRRARSR